MVFLTQDGHHGLHHPLKRLMARKSRIHIPGGLYHVMMRGNDGQTIFFDDPDRVCFESLIEDGIRRFGHRIHAYCWMDNHVHLAVQVSETPLSKIMQNLAFRYTRWVNKRQRRVGHLFQGRYKAILVDADSYLLELVRYIHLNPVRANLVADPAEFPWSGHRMYIGVDRATIGWLTTDWVLSQFADTELVAKKRYDQFVTQGIGMKEYENFLSKPYEGRILGDDRFLEKIVKKAEQEFPAHVSTNLILNTVCQHRQLSNDRLASVDCSRDVSEARALIAYLAVETGAATLSKVGQMFNRDVTSMSKLVSRFRNKLDANADLMYEIKELRSKVMTQYQA